MTALSDDEIMELAGQWFHTGENQHRADGYYYRSLGTPSNVRGSDLIEFARALLAAQPAVQQPAEDAGLLEDENALEAGRLITALANCRDAFPIPEHGSPLERTWAEAMADPLAVPHYVQAVIKAQGGKQ